MSDFKESPAAVEKKKQNRTQNIGYKSTKGRSSALRPEAACWAPLLQTCCTLSFWAGKGTWKTLSLCRWKNRTSGVKSLQKGDKNSK